MMSSIFLVLVPGKIKIPISKTGKNSTSNSLSTNQGVLDGTDTLRNLAHGKSFRHRSMVVESRI